jgi:hypothetical protein
MLVKDLRRLCAILKSDHSQESGRPSWLKYLAAPKYGTQEHVGRELEGMQCFILLTTDSC